MREPTKRVVRTKMRRVRAVPLNVVVVVIVDAEGVVAAP
jgi:hypothetical protein